MIRKLALFALPFVLAAGPASATEAEAVDVAITNLYAPYVAEAPDWDAVRAQQNYSAETAELIAQWEKGLPSDEVTYLADFDWLCECQDWDSTGFRVKIPPHGEPVGERTEVTAQVSIGWGEASEPIEKRFIMVREGGAWKVDDMFSEVFQQGLKAALRRGIADPHAQ